MLGGDFNIDFRNNNFREAEKILDMKSIPLNISTFNEKRNDLQQNRHKGDKLQSQIDNILIHNKHLQPKTQTLLFINLKSEEPYKIKDMGEDYKNCCIPVCNQLNKYGKVIENLGLKGKGSGLCG